jgi:hypothetical protein
MFSLISPERGFFIFICRKDQRSSDERGRGHNIFCVVCFYLFAERISEAAMGRTGTGVWGHNMINMTIRDLLYYTFVDFFDNWNFSLCY